MLGDQAEDPLRGRALREDDPRGADAERVERRQVARVAEEELRDGQDDVVLADPEHAARVPLVAQRPGCAPGGPRPSAGPCSRS